MNTVTVREEFDADASDVRALVADTERFMRAGGFDEVAVDGDSLHLRNSVGIATIELALRVVDTDAALEYVQEDGIFAEMTTRYEVVPTEAGTELVATTDYELDVALVGGFLDATVIERQRKRELTAQFDYVAEQVG
jgi:hypothetical protein